MVYYNNYRYQWNLKKMTPIQYRNHLLIVNLFFYCVLDIGTSLDRLHFFCRVMRDLLLLFLTFAVARLLPLQ